MTDQPIRDERLLEAIEVCRPGSDDVTDPALADLADALAADGELENVYRRVQQADATLAAAFRDVPVPDGLKRRLLERLAVAGPVEMPSIEQQGPSDSEVAGSDFPASSRPGWLSRRWVLAGGLPLSAAVALMVAAFWWFGTAPELPWTTEMVLGEAIEIFLDPADRGEFTRVEPSDKYPISRAVVAKGARTPWRPIRGFQRRVGVAYDLSRDSGGVRLKATLYVLTVPVKGLPVMPPSRPLATQGCATAAWLENGLMYVLVVELKRPRDFESFLKRGITA